MMMMMMDTMTTTMMDDMKTMSELMKEMIRIFFE